MTAGFVVFRLGGQSFATPLEQVREIVRLDGIEPLPAADPPLAGVTTLRGAALPVVDVRGDSGDVRGESRGPETGASGELLVAEIAGDLLGVAVERVLAVVPESDLPLAERSIAGVLPAYVVGVRDGQGGPVLEVDLAMLVNQKRLAVSAAQT